MPAVFDDSTRAFDRVRAVNDAVGARARANHHGHSCAPPEPGALVSSKARQHYVRGSGCGRQEGGENEELRVLVSWCPFEGLYICYLDQ